MKCGVITPIGPGHEDIVQEAASSLSAAVNHGKGVFDEIEWYPIDDLEGELGRSCARNKVIAAAKEAGCDWLFFLDSDDLMGKETFETVAPYLDSYDAIWGAICELNGVTPVLREPQILEIHSYSELLAHDPYTTLQMGHFVRASCLDEHPFDHAMDTGEDFKYYLSLWRSFRCIKIATPLFINRRGFHSVGPRSASGQEWGLVVRKMIADALQSFENTDSTNQVDYKGYWKGDKLNNIVPKGYGDCPEGWEPVPRLRYFLKGMRLDYSKALDFGCGYGRLSTTFDPDMYVGVDLNPEAISTAKRNNPNYSYLEINIDDDLPSADLVFAYTVFLHMDDDTLRQRIIAIKNGGARYIVVCEILGREWRRPGNPPVFNRSLSDYNDIMSALGYQLIGRAAYPYHRYSLNPAYANNNTDIFFLLYSLND